MLTLLLDVGVGVGHLIFSGSDLDLKIKKITSSKIILHILNFCKKNQNSNLILPDLETGNRGKSVRVVFSLA